MSNTPTTVPPPALESVLCTEELNRRPSRPPDFANENRALVLLAQALADSPNTILQTLSTTILNILRCDSAGISLVTVDEKQFHWPAIAGQWKPHIGGGTPRDFGPCGDVLDRNCPLLFTHFERRYTYFLEVMPPAAECLLVPFYVDGKAVGTIWAIAHDDCRKFDAEDLRLLVSLSTFASAAYQAVERLRAISEQADERQNSSQTMREMNQALLVSTVRHHESEQALAKSLIYADDIIATMREPFLVLDHELRVKSANRSFYDSFQVSKAETENRLVYNLGNSQWDIPPLRQLLDEVLTHNRSVHDFEVQHTFPTLGRKTMLLNARPFPPDSKHPELILLAMQDVSAVRERADELAEANRNKDEFLATLAHELRNPLAPIRNAAEYIGMESLKDPGVKSAADVIGRQVTLMVRLIDDLLDMSRISRNKLDIHKRRVELTEVVEMALENSRPLIHQCAHELTLSLPSEPLQVEADPIRLAQIILNLLNNSAKYTNAGGHIWLTVEKIEPTDVVVRVRDNGIGIAPDQLSSIFDMFKQVDESLERSAGGLGIGLTLVRKLVDLHGGTISVTSAGVGLGSEFEVRLPIALEPSKSLPEPTAGAAVPASAYRILIVDDNRDSATSLAFLLRLTGSETQTAFDGQEAVEAAATFRPNVVLLDIGLPKMSGYDACRAIRKQQWGKDMVLIALTGWGHETDRRKSTEAGFDGHLVKPLERAELFTLLAKLQHDPLHLQNMKIPPANW